MARVKYDERIIECRNVTMRFGNQVVLDELSLGVYRGERLVILGGSGAGKSTLLSMMMAETRPTGGQILVNGKDMCEMNEDELDEYRKRMGVLFQSSALFQSMTLAENVALPMQEHTDLDPETINLIVKMKLELVGLRQHAGTKPAEISGGMKKRAGLARALAMDPMVLFYDEPSAGLDPVSVTEVDALITGLNQTLGVTTVVITHEMTSAFRIADRLVLLDQGKFVAAGTPDEMRNSDNPLVHQFIYGLLEGPLADRKDVAAYHEDLFTI
jgi:phospholipid/cholesterol/gamma-HCH transport system ATP-binding protein